LVNGNFNKILKTLSLANLAVNLQ